MTVQAFLSWLEHTGFATAVRESATLFPWFETIHVLAITTVVGTIAIVDLRLLGIASRERSVSELMAQVLPFTRGAFAVAALTGLTLFAAHATDYMHKTPFVAKLVLLGVALVNITVFHRITARDVHAWDTTPILPTQAKVAGGVSLLLWVLIVACGRWTGFV
jgi:hypothetical protein